MDFSWQLVIDTMDYESIEKLAKTNKEFQNYIQANEDRIFKKLLQRDFSCISSPREMYKLLYALEAQYSTPYKNKCFYDCVVPSEKSLKQQIKKSLQYELKYEFMRIVNDFVRCLQKNPHSTSVKQLLQNHFPSYVVNVMDKINEKESLRHTQTRYNGEIPTDYPWNSFYAVARQTLSKYI